jgi:hypothetical protein
VLCVIKLQIAHSGKNGNLQHYHCVVSLLYNNCWLLNLSYAKSWMQHHAADGADALLKS